MQGEVCGRDTGGVDFLGFTPQGETQGKEAQTGNLLRREKTGATPKKTRRRTGDGVEGEDGDSQKAPAACESAAP